MRRRRREEVRHQQGAGENVNLIVLRPAIVREQIATLLVGRGNVYGFRDVDQPTRAADPDRHAAVHAGQLLGVDPSGEPHVAGLVGRRRLVVFQNGNEEE